jgi:predicted nucleic acid-binding protein
MNPQDVPEGPILVDTDVFSFLLTKRGPYEAFEKLVDGHPFVLSFAVVGELRAGAFKAEWGSRRTTELEQRIRACVVMNPTDKVATHYGELHAKFRDQLRKDGSNDMWTAACALSQNPTIPIATNNRGDFELLATNFPLVVVHPET